MNVENTSLPEGVESMSDLAGYGIDETTLITKPKQPIFKKGKQGKVTKSKKREKKEQFRCPLCTRIAKKVSMKTCQVCKSIGMQVTDFCKFCARLHDIVGSPYAHKAQYITTYPNEVYQL